MYLVSGAITLTIVIIDINKPLGVTVENDVVDGMHLPLIIRTQTKQPSRALNTIR